MNLETGDECELLSISVLNLCRKCNANKEHIALLGECLFGGMLATEGDATFYIVSTE